MPSLSTKTARFVTGQHLVPQLAELPALPAGTLRASIVTRVLHVLGTCDKWHTCYCEWAHCVCALYRYTEGVVAVKV